MKKVILTGATGFVGNAVLKELIKNNIYVIAVSRSEKPQNIPNSKFVKYISCDLSEMEKLESKITDRDIDTFYHFAWNGSAGPARADTELQLKNAQWTIDSLNVAKKIGCKRFVVAGSIMEHETVAATYTQGNRPGLGYIYGSGKLVAHTMAMSVANNIGIDLIWAEITNAYGIGELSPRMVNTTLRKVIRKENPQFTAGTQNYDFVYIDDVARAFYLIGKNGKPFNDYVIGSSTAKPLRDFLLEMKASVAPDLDFIFGDIPFTGINLPLEKFDCSKTEKDTGFRAEISFAEGTKRTINWLKEVENND